MNHTALPASLGMKASRDYPPIRHVRERDIDLLLLEELRSTPEFRAMILSQLNQSDLAEPRFQGAYRSVISSLGQSDLVADFVSHGKQWRVYIENKIDADFQDMQLQRYYQRAQVDQENGICNRFLVVLAAPEVYLRGLKHTCSVISYELIRNWFEGIDARRLLGERSAFKVELLTAAINRASRTQVTNEAANRFHHKYWERCIELAPELHVRAPGRRIGGFVQYHPYSMPNHFKFIHKLRHGFVDLQIRRMGKRRDDVISVFGGALLPGMTVARATQSAAIRMEVPQLIRERDFDIQKADVDTCLQVAKRIAEWLEHHRKKIPEDWPIWTKGT